MSPVTSSAIRWGVYLAAGLLLWAVFIECVSRPLHAAGYGQPLTGYLHGLDLLLNAPGRLLVRAPRVVGVREPIPAAWFWRAALSMPAWFLIGYWLRRRFVPPKSNPDSSRRDFLTTGLKLAGGGLTAGVAYALVAEPRWFGVSHHIVRVPDLPPELDGVRAVQLTDIHHGPWLSIDHVRSVIQTTNELDADLVLLTGDYVSESKVYVAPVVAEFAALRPKIGTLAIMGNHDWWEGGRHGVVQREFKQAGIPLIDNDRRILTLDRKLVARAASGLCIAGVGDLWTHHQDYKRALGGLPGDMPRVLLSHNPDVAEEPELARCGCRVDVQLSGHTHGGQIWVPGMGTPVVPSKYGQKYAQGWVDGPVSRVFVCRGVGMSVLPLRCGVRPEIAVLEFRTA